MWAFQLAPVILFNCQNRRPSSAPRTADAVALLHCGVRLADQLARAFFGRLSRQRHVERPLSPATTRGVTVGAAALG